MSNEVIQPELSNLEKIKLSLNNLIEKKHKVLFFVPDVQGTPAASIYEIYFHATVLKNEGYNVAILTESNAYVIPEFIEAELTSVTHISLEQNSRLTVSPEDLLIIPEIFTNVMEQTKNLPCMRVVLFQSVDNTTKSLLPGYDWSMFGIENVLTTSKSMENFVDQFFGKGKFRLQSYNVSVPDYFKNKNKIKRPVVSIFVRNEKELDKIVKLFLSKYPQYRWLNFEPMITTSKPPKPLRRVDFADRLSKNFAALWIDRISSHALFPLECMKVGTVPISLVPDMTPEYIFKDGKAADNCGVWTDSFFQLPDLIADTLRKFLDDEITDVIYQDMENVTKAYSPEVSKEQLLVIYKGYFEQRTQSLRAAVEVLEKQEAVVTPEVL